MVEGVGASKVENELIASANGLVTDGGQNPFGVRAKRVAVGIHHFWFNPDSEVHAQRAHVRDQWFQTIGIHIARNGPVTEPTCGVAARPEPTVVEDEAFDADRRGRGREFFELHSVLVEVHGFPCVQQHRARRLRVRGERTCVSMESATRRGQPFG